MGYFDDADNQAKIQKGLDKSKGPFEPGVYVLQFIKAEKIVSKKGALFLKLFFGDKNHKPIEHMIGWAGKYRDQELQKLGEWAFHLSGVKLTVNSPLNDEDEVSQVCDFFNNYVGKEVKIAVKAVEEIFTKEEEGEFLIVKFVRNRIFMLTSAARSLVISDMSKLSQKLNAEDKLKFEAYQAKKKAEKSVSKEDETPVEESTSTTEEDPFDTF